MIHYPVPCRKCGAPTRLVVVVKSGKGILVDATPRQDYMIVGTTDAGAPLVEVRDTWVAHAHETPRRPGPPKTGGAK